LTFFFRQMPQLIERGFLYIAQPPLYGVRRGKKMIYVKDDDALARHIIEAGSDGLLLRTPSGEIQGEQLRAFAMDIHRGRGLLAKAELRGDPAVINAIVRATEFSRDALADEATARSEAARLESYLALHSPDLLPLQIHVDRDPGSDRLRVNIRARNGSGSRTVINVDLLESPEIRELVALDRRAREYGALPWTLVNSDDDRTIAVEHVDALYNAIDSRGRKGASIQRYKGLGEMSAEQLWETTMDPARRVMLRVRVDDGMATDKVLTLLMGDEVEPRREFIEQNALNVRNLDI
jgi:DNA gyrase subunit B